MAEVKTACCSLEAAQLDGLERPRLPIIKSAEFRTRPSKTRCLLSNKQQKKGKKDQRREKNFQISYPSLKIMKSFQNFILVLTITYLASDYSIASPVQESKGNFLKCFYKKQLSKMLKFFGRSTTYIRYTFFCQITTSIKVRVVFVYELQTL